VPFAEMMATFRPEITSLKHRQPMVRARFAHQPTDYLPRFLRIFG
jgi:hypothetical protein